MPHSYAIIGAGAVGAYYGARLQQAGQAVHFLFHTDYDHVRQHGLHIESKDGNFDLPAVNCYRRAADLPACEVVIVALKATQNHLLPDLLPPALAPTGVVMLMQNGLGGEEFVAGIVGADRVICGLTFVCVNRLGPGHLHHLDYGLVSLGEYSTRGPSERLHHLARDLEQAGFPVQILDDYRVARWNKLVWNIPYNGLSVLLNATTHELMAHPATRQLCEDIMWEVVTGARACGVPVQDEIVQKMLDHTAKMTPYRTSMKIDFDAGRPLEIEAIFGNPLRAAEAAGARLPRLAMLDRQLRFLNSRIATA
jgi:2-dehydropantoate 2-reductase